MPAPPREFRFQSIGRRRPRLIAGGGGGRRRPGGQAAGLVLLPLLPLLLVAGGACRGRDAGADAVTAQSAAGSTAPAAVAAPDADGPPRMTNAEPPFRYPAALYAQRVQGNVTLRLWVDSIGHLLPESTRVAEPSGYPALDSAAVAGSERLVFAPAMRDGRPVGAAILFPVFFRHPAAGAMPGDTVLKKP